MSTRLRPGHLTSPSSLPSPSPTPGYMGSGTWPLRSSFGTVVSAGERPPYYLGLLPGTRSGRWRREGRSVMLLWGEWLWGWFLKRSEGSSRATGLLRFVDLDTPILLAEDPMYGGYEVSDANYKFTNAKGHGGFLHWD